jgi:hypothetical protein
MFRFLALGDSYTIGEGVAAAERWPVQLAARLRGRAVDVADPEIVATTGWTTDELAAGIEEADPSGPYDLVSLLIGVNNQYRGLPVDGYREQFRDLLGVAIAFAHGDPSHVIVLSIPDWGVTPFAEGRDRAEIAKLIDAFNDVNLRGNHRSGGPLPRHHRDLAQLPARGHERRPSPLRPALRSLGRACPRRRNLCALRLTLERPGSGVGLLRPERAWGRLRDRAS